MNLTITGDHVRMARVGLRMEIRELASLAGVDKTTIVRLEAGKYVRPSTMRRIREALEGSGVLFLPAEEGNHSAAVAFRWGFSPTPHADLGHDDDDSTDFPDAMRPTDPTLAALWQYWRERQDEWYKLTADGREVLLREIYCQASKIGLVANQLDVNDAT